MATAVTPADDKKSKTPVITVRKEADKPPVKETAPAPVAKETVKPAPEPPPVMPPADGGVKKALPVATEAPAERNGFLRFGQIALERRHFSCGTIDGHFAMRSTRAIREFQANQGLSRTGTMD